MKRMRTDVFSVVDNRGHGRIVLEFTTFINEDGREIAARVDYEFARNPEPLIKVNDAEFVSGETQKHYTR